MRTKHREVETANFSRIKDVENHCKFIYERQYAMLSQTRAFSREDAPCLLKIWRQATSNDFELQTYAIPLPTKSYHHETYHNYALS